MEATVEGARRLQQKRVITGEGAILEMIPASLLRRFGAKLIDAVLLLGIYLLIFPATIFAGDPTGAVTASKLIVMGLLVLTPSLWESLCHGQTPGKMLFGIRVLRDDGGVISFPAALWRALTDLFECYLSFGSVAVLVSSLNSDSKRLGDLLGGTMVVATPRAALSRPIYLPPNYIEWFQAVQISPPPPVALVQLSRDFLTNTYRHQPEYRRSRARELARAMNSYVSIPDPHQDPERFLAASLVKISENSARKLRREQVQSQRLQKRIFATANSESDPKALD